jgi:hypothetical protein
MCWQSEKRKFPPHSTVHLYRKEWLFRRELPAPWQGIHRKNGILPGITGSRTRNPPKELDSAGNYQFLDEEFTGRMEFRRGLLAHGCGFRPARSKIFRSVTIPETLSLKDLFLVRLIFKNLNMKTSLKWKTILIWPYYELNIYLMKP